jgi:hypothetical protein
MELLVNCIAGLLQKRGLPTSDEQLAAIAACRDEDRLQRWLMATIDVESIAELLAME